MRPTLPLAARALPARSFARSGAFAAFPAVVAFVALAGCGGHGGGGGGGGGGFPVTVISPSTVSSEIATGITLTGSGFTPNGGPVTVRFVAETGTPFTGGTAATFDVPGVVQSFTKVTATTTPMGVSGSIAAHVRVILASLVTLDSAPNSVTVVGPTFTALSPQPLPPASATPFVVDGTGFGPVGGSATVKFTATVGTPFAGGTSAVANVAGTVVSSTRITATSPLATTPAFSANASVTFPSGASAALGSLVAFGASGGGAGALVITTDAARVLRAYLGQELTFHVTATEAGHTPKLRLLDPPAGLEFVTFAAASPLVATIKWQVPLGARVGDTPLFFEASDEIAPATFVRKTVWVDVEPVQGVRVADVTGDGREDLIAVASAADPAAVTDAGTVYVFAGATTPASAPTAVLTVPGAAPLDQLGSSDVPFLVGDVNNDGKVDVVVAAPFADVTATDSGAIYVWYGGAGLVGAKNPDATLTVPGAAANDRLRLRLLADVTGDGVLDVIGGSAVADATAVDSGAVYVWKGGVALAGVRPVDATLAVVGSTAGDGIGGLVRAADFTGDGVLDVVTWSSTVTVAGKAGLGAVYVWTGSAGLAGTVPPNFTLTNVAGFANDHIGASVENEATDAVRLQDVTGDGIVDVVAVAWGADVGISVDAGAVYVWKGGAAPVGLRAPDSVLSGPGALAGDKLGLSGVYLGDLVGSAVLDVLAVSRQMDLATVDSGGSLVWAGGGAILGTPAPAATLTVPTSNAGEGLGAGAGNVRLADVTGDGRLDVIADVPLSNAGSGVLFAIGAVYLWNGGATLAGFKAPDATMSIAGAVNADHLGGTGALLVGDVSGDSVLDVVVATPDADSPTVVDAGAVFVYRGGATLTGAKTEDARLQAGVAATSDALGLSDLAVGAQQTGAVLVDVTGDGILDVVARAERADNLAPDAGAIYVWTGGAGLAGTPAERAILTVPTAVGADRLGGRVAWGTRVVDVTGDGVADVVALAIQTTVGAAAGAGAGYEWNGGATLIGGKSPDASLALAAPSNGDKLGQSSLLVGDLNADGVSDLLLGSTALGPLSRGGVALFRGGAALAGSPIPTAVFQDPAGNSNDQLGK